MENFKCEILNEEKMNHIATFKLVIIGEAGMKLNRNFLSFYVI